MANKYLKHLNGAFQEVEATSVSKGAADAGKIIALDAGGRLAEGFMSRLIVAATAGSGDVGKLVALDGTGKLDVDMMPDGYGEETTEIVASETIANGDYVNIFNDSGTIKVRKACAATSGKEADGFVVVGGAADATLNVFKEGMNTAVSGKTKGAKQYLSVTPGLATETPPSGPGQEILYLGKAITATSIVSEPRQPPVILAFIYLDASSSGIATSLGTTTITMEAAISGLTAANISVFAGSAGTTLLTKDTDYTLGALTGAAFTVSFLAPAALDDESIVTVVMAKDGWVINGGDPITVANTIPA